MTQRENTIQWRDPAEGLAVMPELSGLDFMTKIADGELPGAPIASHFGMDVVAVGPGTLLDSALGCATHTTLPAGSGYTSIEIKVNYLRPVTAAGGALICRGRVTKPGRRVAFAEGEVVDSQGKVVATASGSLLIFPLPGS